MAKPLPGSLRSRRRRVLPCVLLAGLTSTLAGGQFHVTTGALPSGNGTPAHPWQLQVALHHQPAVRPGDTIWVHGGVYPGQVTCALDGSPERPVIVRNFNDERVTIVEPGGMWGAGIALIGSYTWLWGLEIDSNPDAPLDAPAAGINIAGGTTSPGLKVINCIVHDQVGGGLGWWTGAIDGEINGCLVYFNGRQEGVGNNAHNYGIYMQNTTGRKLFKDNILAYNWSYAVHAYSEQGGVNHILFVGNVMYQSGYPWRGTGGERNLIIGGPAAAGRDADTLRDNHLYYHVANGIAGERLTIGYYAPMTDFCMTGNTVVGGIMEFRLKSGSVTGNTFIRTTGDAPAGNAYRASGSGTVVVVRPNDYEKKRGNVIVYNSDLHSTVAADVSSLGLFPGDRYEVRDALNYFGPPVAGGTYAGAAITIPMTGLTAAIPRGHPAGKPFHTAPDFGVFIVMPARTSPSRELPPLNPERYELGEASPSPVRTHAVIPFAIPSGGNVRIDVIDVRGRDVAVLVDSPLERGSYATDFFTTGLSPGIYVFRMSSGEFRSSKKLLVVN